MRICRRSTEVRVLAVSLLRGADGTALAVRLHNYATRPLNDLPVLVGIAGAGAHPTYLNAAAGTPYFDAHLASIGAGASLTWVFTTARKLSSTATPFARVGAESAVPATTVRVLPRIDLAPASSPMGTRVRIKVTNPSAVPQYQLQVYVLGLVRGRYVAAGRTTLAHLGTGSSETLAMTLIGPARPAEVQLEALPTVFQ